MVREIDAKQVLLKEIFLDTDLLNMKRCSSQAAFSGRLIFCGNIGPYY